MTQNQNPGSSRKPVAFQTDFVIGPAKVVKSGDLETTKLIEEKQTNNE